MTDTRISRRAFLSCGAAGLLCACGKTPLAGFADSMTYAIKGAPDFPLSRDRIDRIPYATIAAKIGKGPRSLLVLGESRGPGHLWIAGDRTVYATRDGRLVQTAGVPRGNLAATRFHGPDPVRSDETSLSEPVTVRRSVDLEPSFAYGVDVRATLEEVGRGRILILKKPYDTVLFRERGRVGSLDWEFENLFWKRLSNGRVVKSRQQFHPRVPPITIEALKLPG